MKKVGAVVAFLLLITVFACSKQEETKKKEEKIQETTQKIDPNKTVVAKVNGTPIYKEDLPAGMPIEKAIEKELLLIEAKRRGLDQIYKEDLENLVKNTLATKVKGQIITEYMRKHPITQEEIEEYYEKNKGKYLYLKVLDISTNDKQLAEEIKSKLEAPNADIEEIKKQYADKEVKFEEKNFSKTFNQHFDSFEKGTVSRMVEGKKGKFHIYRIVEVKEPPNKKVVFSVINTELKRQRYQKAIEEIINRMKLDPSIKIEIVEKKNEEENN